MNLHEYILYKSLEKASIENIKQAIRNDMSLSFQQKTTWLNIIDSYSIAKDIKDAYDILTFLMRG